MRFPVLLVAAALSLASMAPALAANPSVTPVAVTHPLTHQVNSRIRDQWMLIQQGLKSGKLTKEQATALRGSLKSVRVQEVSFFKQNGNHDLTSAQQSQLNGMLDKNSSELGETVPAGE